jgi:proton-translocating NAD(P)+ transhydrogenase subunit alpha
MKPGSVIVDLAAETGGNCELTQAGQTVVRHDAKILGPLNATRTMAEHASRPDRAQDRVAARADDQGRCARALLQRGHRGGCTTRDRKIVRQEAGAAAAEDHHGSVVS